MPDVLTAAQAQRRLAVIRERIKFPDLLAPSVAEALAALDSLQREVEQLRLRVKELEALLAQQGAES